MYQPKFKDPDTYYLKQKPEFWGY